MYSHATIWASQTLLFKNLIMKYLLILSLISFSFTVKSQCCPYVNGIEVIPSTPSSSDIVKIATTVTTPNQGSFIYSSHSVSGNTIDIEACYYSGLLTATQTFYDTLEIGVLSPGTYTVDFTAYQASDTICNYTDTMTTTSSFVVIESTGGLNPISNQLGKIYPNPSSGFFRIELPNELNVTHVRVHSLSGKIVHQGVFQEEMNLNLDSGTYFIELLEMEATIGYHRLSIL
jgi:hypothetical protein